MNNNYKCVFVGYEGVGKTCVVNRIINNTFNPHTFSTIGSMFISKKMHTCDTTCSDNKCLINLDIWDTAGQERFASMLPIYYRGASLIILVFSLNDYEESFNRIVMLYDEILEYNQDAKMLLIGTKYDLCDEVDVKSINKFVEDHKYMIKKFIMISSKTGYNISTLITNIMKIIQDVHQINKSLQKHHTTIQVTRDDVPCCIIL